MNKKLRKRNKKVEARARLKYELKAELSGNCRLCGKNPRSGKSKLCASCIEKNAERVREYRQRQAAKKH